MSVYFKPSGGKLVFTRLGLILVKLFSTCCWFDLADRLGAVVL